MFGSILNHSLFRTTVWAVILSFTVSIFGQGVLMNPAAAQEEESSPAATMAAIGFEYGEGVSSLLSSEEAIDILLGAAAKHSDVEIASKSDVLDVLGSAPVNLGAALEVSQTVDADLALYGRIWEPEMIGDQAFVNVRLDLYDAATGDQLSGAAVTGTSGGQLGYSGSEKALYEKAIRLGVETAMGELFSNYNSKMGSITYLHGGDVSVSLTDREGVQPYSRIRVVQSGVQIATLEVVEVGVARSVTRVLDKKPGYQIKMGDKVQLLSNPPRLTKGEFENYDPETKRPRKKKGFSPVLTGLIIVGLVAALAGGGGSKSSPEAAAAPPSTPAKVTSSETCGTTACAQIEPAYSSSSSSFDPAYIPNVPKRSAVPSACSGFQDIYVPLDLTAWDFSFKTNPIKTDFTDKPLKITISYYDYKSQVDNGTYDPSDFVITYCNEETGQIETPATTINQGKYTASAKVTHFSVYYISIDKTTPISSPKGARAYCDQDSITLTWDCNNETPALTDGYIVYKCADSSGSCTDPVETITSPLTCQVTLDTVQLETESCFAVSAYDLGQEIESLKSAISCATPGTVCQGIKLLQPSDGAEVAVQVEEGQQAPMTFHFSGNGISTTYLITVRIVGSNQDVGSMGVPAEGDDLYQVSWGGTKLTSGIRYQWYVTGYNGSVESGVSAPFLFTLEPPQPPDCATPEIIYPSDGLRISSLNPNACWLPVSQASSFILNLIDGSGTTAQNARVSGSTACKMLEVEGVSTGGQATNQLTPNVTYCWNVTAICGDILSDASVTSCFTVIDSPTTDLPAPIWSSNPILPGDQYVKLSWQPIDNPNLDGYYVYRGSTPQEVAQPAGEGQQSVAPIAFVTIDALEAGSVPPIPECGSGYSKNGPGYCDVGMTNGQRYYYALAAVNKDSQEGDRSSPQTTIPPISAPDLSGPGSLTGCQPGAEIEIGARNPLFFWDPSNGALQYELQVTDQETKEIFWQTLSDSNGINYRGAKDLVDGDYYEWKVKANGQDASSNFSQTFCFKKAEAVAVPEPDWCDTSATPPDPSDPLEANQSDGEIDLCWRRTTEPKNISRYIITRQKQNDTEADPTLVAIVNQPSSGRTIAYTDTGLAGGATYCYTLQAENTIGDQSGESDKKCVFLPLRPPVPISPPYGTTVYDAYPEFTFFSSPGASSYLLEVCKSDHDCASSSVVWSASFKPSDVDEQQEEGTVVSLISVTYGQVGATPIPLENKSNPSSSGTDYYWRVRAMSSEDPSPDRISATYLFIKRLAEPTPVTPTIDQYIVRSDPRFSWIAVAGAVAYELRVCEGVGNSGKCDSSGSTVNIVWDYVTGALAVRYAGDYALEPCELDEQGDCSGNTGKYTWQVRAIDAAGSTSGEWANIKASNFTMVPPSPPVLQTPAADSIIQPDPLGDCGLGFDFYGNLTYSYRIVFSWHDLGASSYILKIVDIDATAESGQEVIVYQDIFSTGSAAPFAQCEDGFDIPFSPGREYKWNVAIEGAPFDPNNARKFVTGLPAPNPAEPADGSQVVLSGEGCDTQGSNVCVHFAWNGGTNPSTGQKVPGVIGAASYDIEIFDNLENYYKCEPNVPGDYSSYQYDNVLTPACDFSLPPSQPSTRITWRVRARDALVTAGNETEGNAGPWSFFRTFTVSVPPPVLSSPVSNLPASCTPNDLLERDRSGCTLVEYQDIPFYWSAIPQPFEVHYRIQISDTEDFRNLTFDSISYENDGAWGCSQGGNDSYTCYQPYNAGIYIPMVNGVIYYWRVGSCLQNECEGENVIWNYSDTWSFYKVPPHVTLEPQQPALVDRGDVLIYCPTNFDNSSPAQSVPSVQPDPDAVGSIVACDISTTEISESVFFDGGYSRGTDCNVVSTFDSLDQDTTYHVCCAMLDASGQPPGHLHVGHTSPITCGSFTTEKDDTGN